MWKLSTKEILVATIEWRNLFTPKRERNKLTRKPQPNLTLRPGRRNLALTSKINTHFSVMEILTLTKTTNSSTT